MTELEQDVVARNKAVIQRLYDGCLNGNNFEFAKDLIAEGFTSPTASGLDGFVALVRPLQDAFRPRFTIEDMVAGEDRVAVRWSMLGVHQGPWAGVAPTGKTVRLSANVIYRLQDGKVAAAWPEVDRLGLLQQLGAIAYLPLPHSHRGSAEAPQ